MGNLIGYFLHSLAGCFLWLVVIGWATTSGKPITNNIEVGILLVLCYIAHLSMKRGERLLEESLND